MNNCNFIGRIGKDAVTRYTQGGKAVTGWSLAVDSGWGDKKQAVWIECSLWGERGEKLVTYMTKGAQVGVSGEIGTREHDGKTYVTLNVSNVTLLGGKRDDGERGQAPQRQERSPNTGSSRAPMASQHATADVDFQDDDIPF